MKKYFKNIKNRDFVISIVLLLGSQLALYYLVKLLQNNYHIFKYSIDKSIPFIPFFIIIYNIFYPMIFISYYNIFNHDKDAYKKGIIAGMLGFLIADIIFILYPVEMIRPNVSNLNIDVINKFLIQLTYKLDNPAINCLPSIHCILSFQAVYSTIKCKNYKFVYKLITSIILLLNAASTLLVKQHYAIDDRCFSSVYSS